jgi:uncharacterized membrane protein HdeD (DUF308 family)
MHFHSREMYWDKIKMKDPLCILMGILDILAGIIIFTNFSDSFFIIISIMMILKGAISFF